MRRGKTESHLFPPTVAAPAVAAVVLTVVTVIVGNGSIIITIVTIVKCALLS